MRLHQNTGETSGNCRIFDRARFPYFREVAHTSTRCGQTNKTIESESNLRLQIQIENLDEILENLELYLS